MRGNANRPTQATPEAWPTRGSLPTRPADPTEPEPDSALRASWGCFSGSFRTTSVLADPSLAPCGPRPAWGTRRPNTPVKPPVACGGSVRVGRAFGPVPAVGGTGWPNLSVVAHGDSVGGIGRRVSEEARPTGEPNRTRAGFGATRLLGLFLGFVSHPQRSCRPKPGPTEARAGPWWRALASPHTSGSRSLSRIPWASTAHTASATAHTFRSRSSPCSTAGSA